MDKIRESFPKVVLKSNPFELMVDGVPIREVLRFVLDSGLPGEKGTLVVETLIQPGCEVEYPASVSVKLSPLPESVIEELPEKDGKKRYIVLNTGETKEALLEAMQQADHFVAVVKAVFR